MRACAAAPLGPAAHPGPEGEAQGRKATRLFCIPHAGGSAAFFRELAAQLALRTSMLAAVQPTPCCLPLELPGRGRRHREPLHSDLPAMARDLLARMEPSAGPYALFGHSLGALLAFLCARQAADAGLPLPRALFVSAAAAPLDWERSRPPVVAGIATLPSRELWDSVAGLGGLPDCVAASEELLRHFEPILRADLGALEAWRPGPLAPLASPITVFLGQDDAVSEEQARQWRRFTLGEFRLRSFPGGHFYLQEQWPALAEHMAQALRP